MTWSPSVMPQLCSAWVIVNLIPSTSTVPPLLKPTRFSTPFLPSQPAVSGIARTLQECFFASSTASWMWSKWPWVTAMMSRCSGFFRCSGATGLFMTQGSSTSFLPDALVASQVPWPTQVKETLSFSAISTTPHFKFRTSIVGGVLGEPRARHPPGARAKEVDESGDRPRQPVPLQMDDVPLPPDREALDVEQRQLAGGLLETDRVAGEDRQPEAALDGVLDRPVRTEFHADLQAHVRLAGRLLDREAGSRS